LTILYENINGITFNYAVNLRDLAMNWTKERSVVNIFKQTLATLRQYQNYVGMLKINLNNYGGYNTYLSQIPLNCTNFTSTFYDAGNKIEEKLLKCQEDLVNYENQVIQEIEALLLTVSASDPNLKSSQASAPILKSTSTPSNQNLALQKMKKNLKKFSTAKDFNKAPQVTWPRIPDTAGASGGARMKIRAAQNKKEHYKRTFDIYKKNQTQLTSDQNELNSNLQAGRRKRAADPVIDGVLNATLAVGDQFSTCVQLITDSIAQVDQIIASAIQDLSYPCGKL
jgi:hypothetical protein